MSLCTSPGDVAYVNYTVQYQNGYTGTQQVTFGVATPTVTQINADFLDKNPPNTITFQQFPFGQSTWSLTLGILGASALTDNPGINVGALVTAPVGGDGLLAFVQTAKANHVATNSAGTTQTTLTTGGTYFADGPQPYGISATSSGTFQVSSGALGNAGLTDLPGQPEITDPITDFQLVEDFQTFLMYQPSGTNSIWVALKEIDWGWSAEVSHAAGTSWTANAFSSPPSLRGPTITDVTPTPINPTPTPTWDGIVPLGLNQ